MPTAPTLEPHQRSAIKGASCTPAVQSPSKPRRRTPPCSVNPLLVWSLYLIVSPAAETDQRTPDRIWSRLNCANGGSSLRKGSALDRCRRSHAPSSQSTPTGSSSALNLRPWQRPLTPMAMPRIADSPTLTGFGHIQRSSRQAACTPLAPRSRVTAHRGRPSKPGSSFEHLRPDGEPVPMCSTFQLKAVCPRVLPTDQRPAVERLIQAEVIDSRRLTRV